MTEALFPTRWKHDKPPSLEKFVDTFRDDYACAEYLSNKRWPGGFVCPHCGSRKAWRLETRPWLWQCGGGEKDPGCRKQTSVIAGTVMQGTHLPLRKWFLAAYLMATHSNGISALQLQTKIDVTYKTAWLLLHKLRRAMVNPNREPLEGNVDVDETAIPYRRDGDELKRGGGSSTANQIWVAGAVETVGKFGVGRIRLTRIADRSTTSIVPFVVANTAPGTHLRTDELAAYNKVPDRPLTKVNLKQSQLPAHIIFKWIHILFANLKRWALGTYHGFREKHIDAYLNEFVFRWNRRRSFGSTMDRLFGIGQRLAPITYRDIVGDTKRWKQDRIEEILKMCHPNKRRIVRDLVAYYRVSRVEVMDNLVWWADRLRDEDADAYKRFKWEFDGVPEFIDRRIYTRRKSDRPVLTPRRPGETRMTGRRYRKPDPLVPRILPSPRVSHAPVVIAAE